MIKKITFKNFFSFRETEINLTNENILIGINGSGKTNFLRAFELLRPLSRNGLKDLMLSEWGGFTEIFYAGETVENDISIEYELNGKLLDENLPSSVFYLLRFIPLKGLDNYTLAESLFSRKPDGEFEYYLNSDEQNLSYYGGHYGKGKIFTKRNDNPDKRESVLYRNAYEEISPILLNLRTFFEDIFVYSFFATGSDLNIRKAIIATSEKRLSKDGANLTQIINTIGINERATVKLIKEKLSDVNPNFEDYNFNIFGGGIIELLLFEKELKRPIHVSKISDGTLKFLCLMAIFYNPNRGSVICVDEPETGLHPDMISTVAEGIHFAAQTSQIIIATHSDLLLNHFQFSDILVFRKDEHNATKIDRPSEEDFQWMESEPDRLLPGQLWRDGALGGNRW